MRLPRVVPLVVAALLVAGVVPPASAQPPTERTIADPTDADAAFDIVSVTMSSAPVGRTMAKIVVDHDRRVAVGDSIDVWIDTNDDRVPDLFVTGASFSEYAVYKTQSWTHHGRDISDRGCASLRMAHRRSVVRFDPSCLAPSARFSVSVRSYVLHEPARTDDYTPGRHRLSKKVLSVTPES